MSRVLQKKQWRPMYVHIPSTVDVMERLPLYKKTNNFTTRALTQEEVDLKQRPYRRTRHWVPSSLHEVHYGPSLSSEDDVDVDESDGDAPPAPLIEQDLNEALKNFHLEPPGMQWPGQEPPADDSEIANPRWWAQRNKHVAIDCEMVGIGPCGKYDMLARVSIVNKKGDVLLDKYVKPTEKVTDYRTCVSGIRPADIENGEEFSVVQAEVVNLLQGKLVIGHSIHSDLGVLYIKHPFVNIRDTARCKFINRLLYDGRTPSLKALTLYVVGARIQHGEHNSVEDARAAMSIYNRLSFEWERSMKHVPTKK